MTKTEGRTGPRGDDELGQTLILLAKAFVFLGEEIAAEGGATAQQWAVLHQIGAAGDDGLLPSELAAANKTSRANITMFISRLDQLGYVAISPSRTDGRKKRLRLTRTGKRSLARMNAEKQDRVDKLLGVFTPGERADLLRLSTRLLERLA